jgi:hypothetical protein
MTYETMTGMKKDKCPRNRVSPKTSARRLLKLADFLETQVPEDKFNFHEWVDYDWQGKPDLSCGTSACALGWATTIPEFRKLGLRLVRSRVTNAYVNFKSNHPLFFDDHAVDPHGTSFYAAQRLFGLTNEEAEVLFSPGRSRTLRRRRPGGSIEQRGFSSVDVETTAQVAANIRSFVAWKYGVRPVSRSP